MCNKFLLQIAFWLLVLSLQESKAQTEECDYGPGSIATAVIVTIIITTVLLCVLYLIWKRYWIKNREKQLVLETDPEKGKEDYAYDNAAFGEATSTPFQKVTEKNGKVQQHSTKSKWSQWSPLGALTTKNEKPKTLDDSALKTEEIKIVSLKSHDFTGLGFNIYGNMRDGIFIKDILHRGPASESGKLNSGDRIKSITINFEHVVYEDALTILSYASPYEVVLEAEGGKINNINQIIPPSKTVHLGHPLYRSSSTTDLIQIQKTTRKRLFPGENVSTASSPYSSLQKTRASNAPTLERNRSQPSPQQDVKTTTQSPQQLKTQLEQKIFHNHKQQLKTKDERPLEQENEPTSMVLQKTENKYQKFGIKVLPVDLKIHEQPSREQTSPKSAELSQNDNNINLERHLDKLKVTAADDSGIDEVDKLGRKPFLGPPPLVKKREKNIKNDEHNNETVVVQTGGEEETFIRNNINGSGIKRDKDGIPQEIPSHMLNAAVAARRNRKASVENLANTIEDNIKSPKKQKGRAPAPPEDKTKPNEQNSSMPKEENVEDFNKKGYASDSDQETDDNQSSVNTIELNASDITIHQTEDAEEEMQQNRRTASTGDLTKIQKTRKTSTGTLERAQSLDITDTTIPPLSKKRKGGSIEENLDSKSGSDDSLYGNALVHKEPRLSLALDGLNTFQRSRLKKSTEWGNLEDAIVNLDDNNKSEIGTNNDVINHQQRNELEEEEEKEGENSNHEVIFEKCKSPTHHHQDSMMVEGNQQEEVKVEKRTTISFLTLDPHSPKNNDTVLVEDSIRTKTSSPKQTIILPNSVGASENLLDSERNACVTDPYYNNLRNKIYDTNVSDDMKVSRHSLGSLETLDTFVHLNTSSNGNVSNITIGGKSIDDESLKRDEENELYTTAIDATLMNNENSFEKVSVNSPSSNNVSLTDVNDTVIIEGPSSLTLEIHGDNSLRNLTTKDSSNSTFQISTTTTPSLHEEDSPKSNNYSLTYITEIQVVTPNSSSSNNTDPVTIDSSPGRNNKPRTNFESNVMQFESHIQNANKNVSANEKVDPQIELNKIQEIVEEQLKKLPEMRFSTSSYEGPVKSPSEKSFSSQSYDQLRSNFEKSPPPKTPPKSDSMITKSRIPVATSKTPPTSPERRDSRNFDLEVDKEIVAIMAASPVHSTPFKYQPKIASKNVSITSIRTNSKIPSGLPNPNRPPVPPRKYENNSENNESNNRFSTNGNLDTNNSSFKQWVFNPGSETGTGTSLTFTENKPEHNK